MFADVCCDTLTQSGLGLNSSCGGASIGDACTVFCAEGCQAVSNETSTWTCACHRCATSLCLSFGIVCSECSSLTYNETCIVRCLVGDTGVGDKNTIEFFGDSDGHLQGIAECAEESLELSTFRALVERLLSCDEHFVQTDGNESGTQVQTAAACSLGHKGRVEPPSRKTKRLGWHTKWLVSGVTCKIANEGLRRTGGIRGIHFPSEIGGLKKRAGKKLHHSGISAKGLGKTCRLGKGQKNPVWDPRL